MSRSETMCFYASVRALAVEYLRARFTTVDPIAIDAQASALAAEVDATVRVAVARVHGMECENRSRRALGTSWAWRTLGLPSPRRGQEERALRRALTMKRRIARACHPDTNPGSGAEEQLQEALAAYAHLEASYKTKGLGK